MILLFLFRWIIGNCSIRFFCKKKDKDFVLIPYSDVININDEYYSIPAIEVYGIDLEEIGLNVLK